MTDLVPIRVVQGDDWLFPFTYKDPAGTPVNLTGFEAGGEVVIPGGSIALIGTVLEQGANPGQFSLQLDRGSTANIPPHMQGAHLRAFLISPAGIKTSFPRWPIDVDGR